MEDDAELGGGQDVSLSMPAQEELASSTYKSCDEHLGKLDIHAGGILSESVHGDLAGEQMLDEGKEQTGQVIGGCGSQDAPWTQGLGDAGLSRSRKQVGFSMTGGSYGICVKRGEEEGAAAVLLCGCCACWDETGRNVDSRFCLLTTRTQVTSQLGL